MSDAMSETRRLAESYGLEFKDCGNGHVQVKGHGNLVNYWPDSKKRSAYSPTLDRRESSCTPWDVVRLCVSEAKQGMRPRKPSHHKPQVDLEPVVTNPAGLRHFYQGEIPPWDEDLEGFMYLSKSDEIRSEAMDMQIAADVLREKADDMDRWEVS